MGIFTIILLNTTNITTHSIESTFQAGPTTIRVLTPSKLSGRKKYPVIYLLPVEAKNGARYGDGLKEIEKLNLHKKYEMIFVQPTFSHLPWYADHPTKNSMQQESYLLKTVLPFVEKNYPVIAERKGRYLLGFSKSGWGAFTLLLRHPTIFEKASAWDAPLMMDKPGRYGSGPIFGTVTNFKKYQITLLLKQSSLVRQQPRLALIGHCNFGGHHAQLHDLLAKLKIPHIYLKTTRKKHTWNAGWLEAGVQSLLEFREQRKHGN